MDTDTYTEEQKFNNPDELKHQAKMRMGWRIILLFTAIFLILLIFLRNEVNSNIAYGGALLFAIFSIIHLYYRKNPEFLFTLGAITGSFLAQMSVWFVLDASHYANFIWIAICSMIAYLGVSRIIANILLTFNLLGIGYYIYFVRNDHILAIGQLNTAELTSLYLELLLGFFVLGYFMYQFMSFQKIWEKAYSSMNRSLTDQNTTIIQKNQENIVLLKEIHHRVKNNLQIVVSLLRLQQNELTQTESKIQFQEAINRIMVMSSIHQKLYQQSNLSEIDPSSYLSELIKDLVLFYENRKHVEISLDCEVNALNLKTIVPVGLLINELISNSVKYAFPDKDHGEIQISLRAIDNNLLLRYSDNGTWQENESNGGFGMELIDIFTEQLSGHKELIKNESDTTYQFHLKVAH